METDTFVFTESKRAVWKITQLYRYLSYVVGFHSRRIGSGKALIVCIVAQSAYQSHHFKLDSLAANVQRLIPMFGYVLDDSKCNQFASAHSMYNMHIYQYCCG